ncbi:MAG: hypothetical protein V3V20_03845 [Algisphaera sp.]
MESTPPNSKLSDTAVRSGVQSAPIDPNDPHAPSPGEVTEFIDDVKRFWALNGGWIATSLLIFAVVFGGYRLIAGRSAAAREAAWSDLHGVNTQSLIDLVTENPSNPAVETLAQLRGGDLALDEHHKLADPQAGPAASKDLLAKAKARYQAALLSAPHPIYKLNALEGLAIVAESQRNVETARQHYETLKQTAGDRFPHWTTRADRRLALLDQLPAPVVFAPAAIAPQTGDNNGESASETNNANGDGDVQANPTETQASDLDLVGPPTNTP